MSNLGLQSLTWGTVAAAVASALWLAAGDGALGTPRPHAMAQSVPGRLMPVSNTSALRGGGNADAGRAARQRRSGEPPGQP
jgi:hypothetical protein